MTADLAVVDASIESSRNDLAGLLAAVRSLSDPADVQEARARVEAAKGWAKVHGQAKALRLDLLAVEVEALVRLVQLDRIDLLPKRDHKAARFLAGMTPEARAKFVAASRDATTAAGMCASVWRDEELAQHRRQRFQHGADMATRPTPPDDESGVEAARNHVYDVSAVLGHLIESYTRAGQEFTVNELAEDLIADARIEVEDAVTEGVREVCRTAIRRSPITSVEGTVLPRFVTARVDGSYIRIPVENALVSHLDDMIALRQEQLRQDTAALDRLLAARAKIGEHAHGDERIGDVVARSLAGPQAGAA